MIQPLSLRRAAGSAVRLTAGLLGGCALAAAVFSSAPAFAQEATVAAPAAAPATAPANPALWVIRDADSTIYLFGTVHVLRPNTEWRTPKIQAAFDSASVLWMEIADPSDQSAMMPLIQQHGISPARPLSSLLTAEELASLDAAARTMGASAAQLDPFRPWLAGITLSVAPLIKAGYDPTSGVELVLKAQAEAAGKPIHGLETLGDQIGILAAMPEEEQVRFLRLTLDNFDEAAVMLDAMVTAWATGDVATLDRVVVEDMKEESEYVYRALLVDRNVNWAGQIQTLLEGSGTAFIAVGAAHLAGDDSVQAILATRGVTAERVE